MFLWYDTAYLSNHMQNAVLWCDMACLINTSAKLCVFMVRYLSNYTQNVFMYYDTAYFINYGARVCAQQYCLLILDCLVDSNVYLDCPHDSLTCVWSQGHEPHLPVLKCKK